MNRGKVSENILRRSVLKDIKVNKDVITGAVFGEDCAILNCKGTTAVSQAIGSKAEGGALALIRAVNNLASAGYKFAFASVVLAFSEDTDEDEIKYTQKQMIKKAEELGGTIVGGQTEICNFVKETLVTVTVVGEKIGAFDISKKNIKAGDSIIATKYIGLEGGAILYREVKDKLSAEFDEGFLERLAFYDNWLSVSEEGEIGATFQVKAMKDVSEKGIFNALWELGSAAGLGLRVNLKAIPVRQELIEISNFLNINPYEMKSSGMMLMVTDRPSELINVLTKKDIPAALIGCFTDNNDRVVVNEDEERHLEKIKQDEIYKII